MNVDFFEKSSDFWDSTFPKMVEERQELVRSDPHPIILGISKCKIDRRRSRNVMEALRTSKAAMKK